MTRFEDELSRNNFVCSKCMKCIHWVWPPSEFCNKCLGNVEWLHVPSNATLVEFSRKGDAYFCIAEFENSIRVIGTISKPISDLIPGQMLILEYCTYDKTPKFVFKIS
ncbi:MAG: hypothetical protein ABI342_09480 [Nitrososphaera sp.]|jgi:uncharacterized OB-fold protein